MNEYFLENILYIVRFRPENILLFNMDETRLLLQKYCL